MGSISSHDSHDTGELQQPLGLLVTSIFRTHDVLSYLWELGDSLREDPTEPERDLRNEIVFDGERDRNDDN